jgi:hypothetical protein
LENVTEFDDPKGLNAVDPSDLDDPVITGVYAETSGLLISP